MAPTRHRNAIRAVNQIFTDAKPRFAPPEYSSGHDETLVVNVRCALSEVLALLPATALSIRESVLYMSLDDANRFGIPCYENVVPRPVAADWDNDPVLPLLRPKVEAPANRPWLYFTHIEGEMVLVAVYGKQDVANLKDHKFSCWNGVYIRRTEGLRPPTLFGVVPVSKPDWHDIAVSLRLSHFQRTVLTSHAMVPLSHGRIPDEEELFNQLNSVEDGFPVSVEQVVSVVEYCERNQFSLPAAAQAHRHERINSQVQEGLHALQSALQRNGIATPPSTWAIEHWLYRFMSHPHRLTVHMDIPPVYGWEGPEASDAKRPRCICRLRVETQGHECFTEGVTFGLALPAMTGRGLNFLTYNLDQYLPEIDHLDTMAA